MRGDRAARDDLGLARAEPARDLSPVERRKLLPAGGEDTANPPQDTETRMRILIQVGYRIGLAECLLHD